MHFRIASLIVGLLLVGVCSRSADSAQNSGQANARFERIGPFGGDVRSLLIDSRQPRVAYLGTSNGKIFKSQDAGASWAPLLPGIAQRSYVIDTLVQHPEEPEHIYAGAWDLHSEGGGLFESRDGGATWKRMALPGAPSAVRGISICARRTSSIIAGTLSGAFVSADGGRSWRQVGGKLLEKAESVAIDPVDDRILYVGTWRLGYRSNDSGKTWKLLQSGMPLDSDVFSIAIDKKNPAVVYSSACSGVYRSANRAQQWTRLRVLPNRFTIRAQVVYVDPVNAERIYTGTTEGLFVSDNSGGAWRLLTSNAVTVNAIQVDPRNNSRIMIGTEYQGILVSTDAGRTWKESNRGFIHKQIAWVLADPTASGGLIAGVTSGSGGVHAYDAKTGAWTPYEIGPGIRVLSFLVLPQNRGRLAGTVQGVYWQPNAAASWNKLKGSISKLTVRVLAADPANPVVYAGTDQGVYRSALATLDFRMPPGYRLSPSVWSIVAPPSAPGVVYAGSSLGVLRSWDRGTTWNVISSFGLPPRVAIEALAVSPSSRDLLFAGTSVGLFESKNGGVHWNRVNEGLMGVDAPSIAFLGQSGERIVAADRMSGGVFYSRNGGVSWDKIAASGFDAPVSCLTGDPENPSRVYVGTKTDGLYTLEIE